MPPDPQPHSGAAGRTAHAGVAFGLDRLRGPVFRQLLAAPDAPGGGSGQGSGPKGVRVPGLQAVRQHLGLSQAELAARSGVSEKTISRLERGGRAQYVTLERLARAPRVSRQRLLQSPP